MHFGSILSQSVHEPWRAHYIDYEKLKALLREDEPSSSQREWTEQDEADFIDELIHVQLDKVHDFQRKMHEELRERTAACEARLAKCVDNKDGDVKGELDEALKELDFITSDIEELERFSRINFTGFLKAAKKHDRRSRGTKKGKGQADPKVKPMLQVRLGQLEFNKEDYSPLLYRLSTMYDFVRQNIGKDQPEAPQTRNASIGSSGTTSRYASHKFWVHPDNILEVKTFLLRRLPVLVYNPQNTKHLEGSGHDPKITSVYFDNPDFSLYEGKVLKKKDASSLRLRWYGQLSDAPEIQLERKTIRGTGDDFEGAVEERIQMKEKYIRDFISGTYSLEKQTQKKRDRKPDDTADADKFETLVESMQKFIKENDLQPALRASYTRTAFQIPGDDRIRVSLDTELALIREDALDSQRPCRDPEDWHRRDIDDSHMEYPFPALRKGEISRFPYALLELKVREQDLHSRNKSWVHELMSSHLVHAAPRFSKFVHGVAVLFDDYVNSFPFWLSELEEDIRTDPKAAWDAEQQRKKKQIEDETAVGSFRASLRDFGGRETPPTPSGITSSPATPSRFPSVAPQGLGRVADVAKILEPPVEEEEEPGEEESGDIDAADKKPLDAFRQLFPSFSTSRYSRAHSVQRPPVELPPGVYKPRTLLMHEGPVQVEAKVWLANQRTFVKWMHITVLLASLSLALFNAAKEHNTFAKAIAIVYTGTALFAGVWGWSMYMWRSKLITQRSGKDFDNVVGPLVVCVALAIALVVNFLLKYEALDKGQRDGPMPVPTATATATVAAFVEQIEL